MTLSGRFNLSCKYSLFLLILSATFRFSVFTQSDVYDFPFVIFRCSIVP